MKKVFALLLTLSLFLSLCACGGNPTTQTQTDTNEQTSPTTTEVETETETDSVDTPPAEPAIVYTPVQQGKAIKTADSSEFTIVETGWAYEKLVRTGENSRHWIGAADGDNIIMYVKITYNNKATSAFEFTNYSKWDFSMLYDSTYTYAPERSVDTFPSSKLQPLMTGDFYVVFELPEFMRYDGKAIEITFAVDDTHYTYQVRAAGPATTVDRSLEPNEKRIIADNGEITLIDTYTSKTIMPPKPGRWYSYYEAQDGYTYVVAEFVIKNLSDEQIHTSEAIRGSVIVNGQSVEGMCILANGDLSDVSAIYAFEVLAEHTAFFVVEIPDDKLNSNFTFSIIFGNEKFEIQYVG